MSNITDLKNIDDIRKTMYKLYRGIFGGLIKETFLIDILNRVVNDLRYERTIIRNTDFSKLFEFNPFSKERKDDDFDICKMIVMTHYLNTLFADNYQKGRLQESNEYKKKLADEVLKMFDVSRIATFYYSGSSLEAYLPIIYYVSALATFCGSKHDEIIENKIESNSRYNVDFNLKMIYKILHKIKACIALADIRTTDELLVVYRTLIESFMTYALLWDEKDGVINSFYEHNQESLNLNYGSKVSEKIKLEADDMGTNEIRFANYGWIRHLDVYKQIAKANNLLNISGLSKLLDKKYEETHKDIGTILNAQYKMCNPQAHSSTVFLNYLQLELIIFTNIGAMLNFVSDIFGKELYSFNFLYGDTDLKKELLESLQQSSKIVDMLANDENKLRQTNIDYRDRAICCMKIK